ncbi:NAD-dependent succinate-semialdehyde dehydrogenase [Candidatus Epulonipiscium viviparus]|uniref:NAD-dependent succinate-semialdehyde dehydrogenase n=1 Tax=Candidatus Epulonipiscium viviparus TaxID=420336 RepID=UPI00016C0A03|nr:NAD-dependent succinate-semialdehyde dehydrogenase [Candidatus Epulopiscium viviparus]
MYFMTINGKIVEGTGVAEQVYNPATGEVLAEFKSVSSEQCEEALVAADAAFKIWSKASIAEREKVILAFRSDLISVQDELVALLMLETGKPLNNATYDYEMLIDCLYFFNEENKRLYGKTISNRTNSHLNIIDHVPLGVVVGYLAFNFPILNLGYKLGPILASGCTCVLKPSSLTPLTSLKIGEIANKHFPAGVINIIAGKSGVVAPVMNKSAIPKMMTMIGSSRAGKSVIRDSADYLRHYSLELGGNAPAVVCKDADVAKAAAEISDLKYGNAGQVCVSPNRVFVHKNVADEFVEEVLAFVKKIKLKVGDDSNEVLMGPIASEEYAQGMVAFTEDAIAKGAKLLAGGKRTGVGYFFEPTVLLGVTNEMRVYKEEVFGPIMSIIPFDDSDDIVALANDTEYGLAAYVYTKDLDCALELGSAIEAGSVSINEPLYDFNLPHGGLKESGIGKDCSLYSLEEYYYVKRLSIKRRG